jgi:hypothetical protein
MIIYFQTKNNLKNHLYHIFLFSRDIEHQLTIPHPRKGVRTTMDHSLAVVEDR